MRKKRVEIELWRYILGEYKSLNCLWCSYFDNYTFTDRTCKEFVCLKGIPIPDGDQWTFFCSKIRVDDSEVYHVLDGRFRRMKEKSLCTKGGFGYGSRKRR
ncbi:hypothetical protein A3K70_01675 [Candidatus Bathyarchaeota archaeon RBG_16_48_13]|nr:MAG: hypothetical protein A3K70_01675 [Candidatus Bathyarchaeota archaeon RBG_16_48_13]